MGVEDPAREGIEQRAGEHGAEACHGHEVDVVQPSSTSITRRVKPQRSNPAP